MNDKQNRQLFPNSVKIRNPFTMISMVLVVALLTCLYLSFSWNRYQKMAESEATQVAKTAASLLHTDQIKALGESAAPSDVLRVEQSLTQLVEVRDTIYYVYLLKEQDGKILIVADSAAANSGTSHLARRSCEQTAEINRLPFETGQSFITKPISNDCGRWIRALVPIFDGESIIAVLGLSYSAAEWHASLHRRMVYDLFVVGCVLALALTIFYLLRQNKRYKETKLSRQESERSKSVFFSQLPGMAYRCKNDCLWTMEFVSEGCYELTGYKAESLVQNRDVTYLDIMSPKYRDLVRAEWDRVLTQHKRFRGEYEIITKSGKRKWVLELGQGIYDANGNVEALEGIVLNISEHKKKDFQIAHLKRRDFLTGLYNRNYIEQEKNRLDKPQFWPLSIAICDIDGLRVVNDAYGHEEGDRLIIKIAQIIQNHLRDEYVLARTGGGEFTILMPHTSAKEAAQLKADIKSGIESYNRVNKNALYAISVSIGHATKETKCQQIQTITTEADKHLRRRKMLNQNSSHSAIVFSIMATLYAKSQETEEHGQRLGRLCMVLGKRMGLPQTVLDDLQLLSKLHDIGKIGIDDHILKKPTSLNEEEWNIMKKHPEIGYRIAMTTPQLTHIAKYILHHHERWDGTGYPAGLKGEEIPIVSRILAIADAFDAMTQDRVYRKSLSKKDALKEIEQHAGTQFDPHIAKLFVLILRGKDSA